MLVRFDNLWQMPFPYVLTFHHAPTDGADHSGFHFHLECHPPLRKPDLLKYLAGPEIGGGSFLSDTLPEEKAAELLAVLQRALQGGRWPDVHDLLEPVLDLHETIRQVADATERDRAHALARVSRQETSDTIYAIDRRGGDSARQVRQAAEGEAIVRPDRRRLAGRSRRSGREAPPKPTPPGASSSIRSTGRAA